MNESIEYYQALLSTLGIDTNTEHTKDTPKRHVTFLTRFLTKPDINFTSFTQDEEISPYKDLVVQRSIPMYSLCEHHILPFFGSVDVGYYPNGRILGLSKLARLVDYEMRCLGTQERLTMNIANRLQEITTSERGVICRISARHMCMEMRGVETPGITTVTLAGTGVFNSDSIDYRDARKEFLDLL